MTDRKITIRSLLQLLWSANPPQTPLEIAERFYSFFPPSKATDAARLISDELPNIGRKLATCYETGLVSSYNRYDSARDTFERCYSITAAGIHFLARK